MEPIVMLLDENSELRWTESGVDLWTYGSLTRRLDHFEAQFIQAAWRSGYAAAQQPLRERDA